MAEVPPVAVDFRRMFKVASWAARLGPLLPASLASSIGVHFSPYRPRHQAIQAAMAAALHLPAEQADLAWRRWLSSHGLFALTVHRYGRLSKQWLARQVVVDNPDGLLEVVQRGGMVLTAHTHHHNTLGCVLGLAGCHITGLAAPTLSSPLYPYLGDLMERINAGSASHFGGGAYLFTDEMKTLVRESRRLLAEGKVIVSLCDFSQAPGGAKDERVRFLGRVLFPPTGSLELAMRSGVPIHVALLFPCDGRLKLEIEKLDSTGTTQDVLQRYFDVLARTVTRYPWAWQGWDWFDTLNPDTEH
jgi:lauroyl/myristoyl acyltransferase